MNHVKDDSKVRPQDRSDPYDVDPRQGTANQI